MAPSIPVRHHGQRFNLKFLISKKVSEYPYSGAGKLSQTLGIGKSAASKLQKSSSVGATYNPCACYNDPSTGQTATFISAASSSSGYPYCQLIIPGTTTSDPNPRPLC
jgi:hypothetical protein